VQKIPTLFQRNYDSDYLVRDELVAGCEWVIAGEGVATRKYDGACCQVRFGIFWKRFELKRGKPIPEGFITAEDPDPKTGNQPGWLPVSDGPEDGWFRAAYANVLAAYPHLHALPEGTYEAIGPHFQGNPERLDIDLLERHGDFVYVENGAPPRDFAGLRAWLEAMPAIEGIVWHHPDGRMCKIKRRDFGFIHGSVKRRAR
jgi:hypothetical protein